MPLSPGDLPAGLEPLSELALDLRWTWSHAYDDLWRAADPAAWEAVRNPWLILQSTPRARWEALAKTPSFVKSLAAVVEERRQYLRTPWWGASGAAGSARSAGGDVELRQPVAYFSMEYGFGDALPLYAGGLGVLSADHLKAASDLAIPTVAVGLLYQEGYFRQLIDADGRQEALYPYNDPSALPIRPERSADGDWLRVPVALPGRQVHLRVWRATVGRIPLYLLDSNDPFNTPADRGITGKLYDGGNEMRLRQEIVLGLGGPRALQALGIDWGLCHLNEGHTGFVVLEAARMLMARAGLTFAAALWARRAGTIFTTHTPVAAGFDAFDPDLMAKYFPEGRDLLAALGLSLPELLALGRIHADDAGEPFRPAYLAVHGAARVNGVSALHGQVSRRLFQPLFPRFPGDEVPVTHVTNGVHTPTWDSRWADAIWTDACGKERWRVPTEALPAIIAKIPDEALWSARASARHDLIRYARLRTQRQLGQRGAPPDLIEQAPLLLDADVLTLGFARRFAAYKRPNLLLRQPDRLRDLLTHTQRPVQLVIAGKAHPDDDDGKRLIQAWVNFIKQEAIRPRVVFLEDYDLPLAEEMVQGVDVWINTPRRPMEACGTSGMKVLVNGGLNLSVLDGWWAEAYAPDVGWAVGDPQAAFDADTDGRDADDLYRIIEDEIVPLFYDRDAAGIPRRWLQRVRASLARLAPQFSANRMVREYLSRLYCPAEGELDARLRDGAQLATVLAAWEQRLRAHFPLIRWGRLAVAADGQQWRVSVEVYLDDLDPDDVAVEVYADPLPERPAVRAPMTASHSLPGTTNGHLFECHVPSDRPASDFTPRVLAARHGVRAPRELPLVAWHH
ncbi:MAG TPA: alpha-glucan family phosphorylase [Polyangia bacterium]|nr:alpha-glucan family phosphorylase [Polyangia bacterium]